MEESGNLSKMAAQFKEQNIEYALRISNLKIPLHPLLNNPITLEFTGRINCVSCGKITKKSFGQGFCYNCFMSDAENAECIIRPELCMGHLGKGRDPAWELEHHVQPHVVYLACSGGVKVGVTRSTQVPVRWIDQGATKAIILSETPNRYLAGITEVHLKSFFNDKTDWRKMLRNIQDPIDLLVEKEKARAHLPDDLIQYVNKDTHIFSLNYPVLKYPDKIQSHNLEKNPVISGILTGIKGQYLMIDDNKVINIRNHSGFHVIMKY